MKAYTIKIKADSGEKLTLQGFYTDFNEIKNLLTKTNGNDRNRKTTQGIS